MNEIQQQQTQVKTITSHKMNDFQCSRLQGF